MSTPVIDFHIHLAKYTPHHPWVDDFMGKFSKGDYKVFVQEMSNPANFVKLMKANGVDYGVVLAELSPVTTGICNNEDVAAFCRDYDCLIPFCTVNPYLTARPAELLEKLVKEDGFKGLKLYPTYNYFYPNEPMMYPIYAKAEELGIPVMFHTGSSVFRGSRIKYGDPLYFDDLAVDFPGLKIIMVHSGRGFWYDRAFFLARIHPNVFMEIAGLPPQNLLKYFPDFEANADKILFATDWPGLPSIAGNIQTIRNMPISSESAAKILGGNAAKLLGMTL
ncbi:MAG: amidohydrolase family protein [Carboxydocellales bacterium]